MSEEDDNEPIADWLARQPAQKRIAELERQKDYWRDKAKEVLTENAKLREALKEAGDE